MQNPYQKEVSKTNTDFVLLFKNYLKLIWKNKYWILLIFLSISIFWTFAYKKFLGKSPEFSTTSIIRFDNPSRYGREANGLTDFAQMDVQEPIPRV